MVAALKKSLEFLNEVRDFYFESEHFWQRNQLNTQFANLNIHLEVNSVEQKSYDMLLSQ